MADQNAPNRRTRWGNCALIGLFTAATFFLFGPLNLYVSNKNEFSFYLRDILPWILGCFLLAALVLTVIPAAIRNKRARDIVLAVILGLGIGFYVQGNFMSGGYGQLNGKSIDWDAMTGRGIVNTVVWALCILLPVAAVLFVKGWKTAFLRDAALALTAVQLLATVIACVAAPAKQDVDFTINTDGAFTLAEENNVAVFLTDTFYSELFEEIITEDPSYYDVFSGFTFFEDTSGVGCSTKGTLPYILTGVWNENKMPFHDYIDHAYDHNTLYETLLDLQYDTRLYVTTRFVSAKHTQYFSNITGGSGLADPAATAGLMYKFTAFTYMPHFLKPQFWFYSGDFSAVDSGERADHSLRLSPDSAFYSSLCEAGITVDPSYAGTYRFYYLNGPHAPYVMDEHAQAAEEGTVTQRQQAIGTLEILRTYLEQLHETGLYDSTTVMILADHGAETKNYINPMLCVKPAGAADEPLKVSSAEIAFSDLQPTLLKAITGDESLTSVFDIPEGESRERRAIWYVWNHAAWQEDYLPDLSEILITGDVRDLSTWRPTGHMYTASGEKVTDYSYELGTELYYNGSQFDEEHYFIGLSYPEENFTWTDGEWVNWNFRPVQYEGEDLVFRVNYVAALDNQKAILHVNGYEQELTVGDGETLEYVIPEEYILDGTLSLFLQLPNYRRGDGDARDIAVAIRSISLNAE